MTEANGNEMPGTRRQVISGNIRRATDEMMERARRVAAGLRHISVAAGDSVAILMRNSVDFLEISNGTGRIGAYPVPLNWHLAPSEVAYVLADCGARVLFVHQDLLPMLADTDLSGMTLILVEPATGADADAGAPGALRYEDWLEAHGPVDDDDRQPTPESTIYTSGTTGRPKGVRRQAPTPEMRAALLKMREDVYGLRPGIRLLIPAPLYHAAPNVFSLRGLEVAETLVVMPRFDPPEFLRLIEEHRITNVVMVPTMFVRLLRLPQEQREGFDLSSLRYVLHAAAPCPVEVKRQMIDWFGPIIGEWYGTTETSVVTLALSEDWLRFPGTVGRPLPGAEVKILRPDKSEAAPMEEGDVYMKLDCMPDFTYQNSEADRANVGEGDLVTGGDIGYKNSEGFLYICDRRKDMIISGGVNIYPAEIEGAMIPLPGIRDCAVIGVPDAEFGEAILALVVADAGVTVESIQTALADKLARYKIPRRIEFREMLPRDDVGKLLKRKLREPYWAEAAQT